jgi:hypothetical protein
LLTLAAHYSTNYLQLVIAYRRRDWLETY